MEQRSVFFEEWIKSLREQYKYVVRNNDQVTLPSLTEVMHNVGFRDDELAQLRVEATMHIDEVGADYVPDLMVLNQPPDGQPHPAECTCPQCIPIDESQFDEAGQPLTHVDPEETDHEVGHVFPVAKIEATEAELEHEPLTVEEHLADADETLSELEDTEEADDDPEDDPGAPQQLSMF